MSYYHGLSHWGAFNSTKLEGENIITPDEAGSPRLYKITVAFIEFLGHKDTWGYIWTAGCVLIHTHQGQPDLLPFDL